MHAHGLVPPLNCMVMLCERLFYGCSTVVNAAAASKGMHDEGEVGIG